MIEAKITKKYKNNIVFKDLEVDIKKGDIVVIEGLSGSGKSTLLNILSTIDNDFEGNLKIDGSDITNLSDRKRAKFRSENIGFIFQNHELIPEFNIFENCAVPLDLNGKRDKAKIKEKIQKMFPEVHNIESFLKKYPYELSGGQQQRVSIIRAIIHSPKIVFADEPTGNLDINNRNNVIKILKELKTEDMTLIIVTHDKNFAKDIGANKLYKFEIENNKKYFCMYDLKNGVTKRNFVAEV